MRLTFFQKKALLISANLFSISFTLIGAGTATYAWFASQNIVTATGMSVSCAAPDSTLSYQVLKYDENTQSGIASSNADDFTLPEYDQYITSKNVYCNAIIVATISFNNGGFASTDTLNITATTSTSTYKVNGVVGQYTSNVIAFKSFIYSYNTTSGVQYTGTQYDTTNQDSWYKGALSRFNDLNSYDTFVTDESKSTTTTSECNVSSGTFTATSVTVYFECIYDPTLVSALIDTIEYQDGRPISLTADITSITFAKEAA